MLFPLPILPRLIVMTKDAVPFWRREVCDGKKAVLRARVPCCLLLYRMLQLDYPSV